MDKKIRPIGPLEGLATCLGVAALAGVAVFGLLMFIGDWTFLQAFFGGFVVFVILSLVLGLTLGRASSGRAVDDASAGATAEAPGSSVDPAMLQPRNVNAPSPHKESVDASAISDTQGPDLNDASVNRAKDGGGAATFGLATAGGAAAAGSGLAAAGAADESAAADAAADQAAADAAAAEKAAADAAAAEKAAADAAAAEQAAAAQAAAATPASASAAAEGPGTKPAGLDGPRDGGADDLKRIKGIGPKLEKLCNTLGFYHFDQIAGWSADEVAWVDQNLEGFKGRVTRDEWVKQAGQLARGEETAFSKKVDKGGVY